MKLTLQKLFILLLFVFSIQFISAQRFHMVKDINTATNSNPSNSFYSNSGQTLTSYAVLNGISYFAANDGLHGIELWRTNGTDTGTYMVRDINNGVNGSNVNSISVFKNELYFVANDGIHGIELWKSDGSEEGTNLVKDINPGAGDASPYSIMNNGKYLFFGISDGGSVCELWKSNGTKSGTSILKKFTDSALTIYYPTKAGKRVCFFVYNTILAQQQLWSTDSLYNNVIKIKDISPFQKSAVASNGKNLYFGDSNGNLWKSDGTSEGTAVIKTISGTLSEFIFYKDLLVFTNNNTFYKSDGTALGTQMFFSGQSIIDSKTVVNDYIFFFSSIGGGGSLELWKTDATTSGTILVKQIDPNFVPIGTPVPTAAIENKLYFSPNTQGAGFEPWRSDGTKEGTIEIKDIFPGVSSSSPLFYTLLKKKILFVASEGQNGRELWSIDTLTSKTSLLKDINISYTVGSTPSHLTIFNDNLIFAAKTDAYGNELWKTDGSEQGTQLIKDIEKGSSDGIASYYPSALFFQSGNNLYFTGQTQELGAELWKTSGGSASTTIISNLSEGSRSSQIFFSFPQSFQQAANVNNRLYYAASPASFIVNYNLFTTNAPGENISIDTSSPYRISNLIPFGKKLFYIKNNPYQLWITDSLPQNKKQITAAYPDGRNSLFTFKNSLYYGSTDNYMWKTDGTNANTKLFKKIIPDPYYFPNYADLSYDYNEGYVSANAVLSNTLYFAASDSKHGSELWKTDGTAKGTVLVKDINIGSGDSQLGSFVTVGNIIYFFANDGVHGRELWKTDGTEQGTELVKNITEGALSSEILSVTQLQSKIVFLLYNGIDKSFKLWQSDGTSEGTKEVDDIALSNIQITPPLKVIDDKIYFAATSIQYGNELWVGTLDVVLAVALQNFSGKLINNADAQINWSTATEQNSKYFNLQRRFDNVHFATIAKVYAKGNAASKTDYQYLDKNVTAPIINKIYYRLVEISTDGKSSFSNTVLLTVSTGNFKISVMPNPTHSDFQLTINNSAPQQIQIQVVNAYGRTILEENKNINEGKNILYFNSASWPGGIYIVNVVLKDGSIFKAKVIKQ